MNREVFVLYDLKNGSDCGGSHIHRKNYLKSRKNQFKWKVIGWYSESVCSKCGQKAIYLIYKYDALCCTSCNEWLDESCSDPNCTFCSGRPETLYEAYILLDIDASSAGRRKFWRCENYRHKADGMRKHKKRIEAIEDGNRGDLKKRRKK